MFFRKESLRVFNNKLTIKAILDTSINFSVGFEYVKSQIQKNDSSFLKTFKFIGDTTCYHLAKNIGLNFAKPDRHLLRISKKNRI